MSQLLKRIADTAHTVVRLLLGIAVLLVTLVSLIVSYLLKSDEYDEDDFEYIDVDKVESDEK